MGKPLTAMPGLTRDGVLGKWIWQLAEEDALPLEEITQELASQYLRFIELFGRKPTHLDSHHHVHMFPQIFPIVARFAAEEGIALRIDRQPLSNAGDLPANLRSSQGFSSAFYGEEISEALFLQVLDDASHRGDRSLEVMCHPAFIDNTIRQSAYCFPRLTELDVLTSASLKGAIAQRGYAQLGSNEISIFQCFAAIQRFIKLHRDASVINHPLAEFKNDIQFLFTIFDIHQP